ncbi:hypothetical protein C2845_PM07G15790 [Panicum miliaceum]|uniref:Myb-like domain-containing protein n=1 Tax=Panicum miliaceum TaxID=4540 RepID=A0A3L6SPQ3_PANMI|nr:hypothetical protein C2845_PM07G15790 [Panicum miliaceum]
MPSGFTSTGPTSLGGSMAFFSASGGSSSRGDESSPIVSASQAGAPPMHPAPVVQIADDSESSTDDGGNNGGRKLWSEDENLRLVSAWLKNSNDPIGGNGKARDRYWKEVAAECNKHTPNNKEEHQCNANNTRTRISLTFNKFNGFYNDVKERTCLGARTTTLASAACFTLC